MVSSVWRIVRNPWLVLAAQVAALEFAAVAGTTFAARDQHHLDAGAYGLVVVATGAMALSRRWPVGAVALALAATLAYDLRHYPDGPIVLGLTVALYRAADPDRPRRSVILGGITAAALVAANVVVTAPDVRDLLRQAIATCTWAAAVLAVGHAMANRRAYVAAVEDRARLAEQTREAEALRRVAEERLRIARELHDVLAHSISVINIQAGVAAHVLAERPEQAEQALLAIKATSKEALRELRGLLGVLRQVDEGEPRAPAPGLAQLDTLVDTAARAGLATRVAIRGRARALPPSVDLAAYRIVQESLTNSLRHAGPASAAVTVAYEDGRVVIEVVDDGRGAGERTRGAGHGIAGMRERAAAVGGDIEIGPRPDGGFRVRACLPATGESPS